jgi:hypothetical protein
MHRLAMLSVTLVASTAAAEPPFAIGLDYTVARGSTFESWDLGWRLEAGLGVHIGPWHATASASGHMHIKPDDLMRDSERLTAMGAGARVQYHWRVDGHGTLFIGAGFERIWVSGDRDVKRYCQDTNTCLAGYYSQTPSYNAWAPQLRVGIGPASNLPTMRFAGTFELILEPMAVRDVPPDGISDIALYGAFTFSFGFGSKRR